MIQLEPGWLDRQVEATMKEVASWPAWMRRGLNLEREQMDIEIYFLTNVLQIIEVTSATVINNQHVYNFIVPANGRYLGCRWRALDGRVSGQLLETHMVVKGDSVRITGPKYEV